ncbi:hypothetical protein ACGF0D_23035 [Kitasatospora sp. NPDC048298]
MHDGTSFAGGGYEQVAVGLTTSMMAIAAAAEGEARATAARALRPAALRI